MTFRRDLPKLVLDFEKLKDRIEPDHEDLIEENNHKQTLCKLLVDDSFVEDRKISNNDKW